jgi:predicted phosphodiesterase
MYEYAETQEYKKVDLLLLAGDNTDNGTVEQLTELKKILDDNLHEETQKLIVMGNHEYYKPDEQSEYAPRFESVLGVSKNNHIVINGYHFIGLSLNSQTDYSASVDWLQKELESANTDSPDKPIFVVQHFPCSNTVYGSDVWGTNQLSCIYSEYPQIIDFSGHTHYPINDPRIVDQDDFTSVGCGTMNFYELESGMIYGTTPPGYGNAACMYIVEVYSDSRVVLKPYDLITSQFYPVEYTMKNTANKKNFVYTDERYKTSENPYFLDGTTLYASNLTSTSVTLSFKQAYDKDCLHSYQYDIYEAESGKRMRTFKIWSDFYFLDRPENMTYTVTGLNPNTKYRVTVTAINSFGKKSVTPIETIFTTTN